MLCDFNWITKDIKMKIYLLLFWVTILSFIEIFFTFEVYCNQNSDTTTRTQKSWLSIILEKDVEEITILKDNDITIKINIIREEDPLSEKYGLIFCWISLPSKYVDMKIEDTKLFGNSNEMWEVGDVHKIITFL